MVESNYYEDGNEEQNQTDNTGLYKKFGRESDVGKLLYGIYAPKTKPKIEYPAVKTKPRVE
jgi:hypothetical protein